MLKTIELIQTEDQYEMALERAYELMQLTLSEGDTQLEELEILGILIEQYEKIHYPI